MVEDGKGASHADLTNTDNADLVGRNLLLIDDELHQLILGGRHLVGVNASKKQNENLLRAFWGHLWVLLIHYQTRKANKHPKLTETQDVTL